MYLAPNPDANRPLHIVSLSSRHNWLSPKCRPPRKPLVVRPEQIYRPEHEK